MAGALAGTGAWRTAPEKDRPLRKPGSLPYPHLPAGTDTIPQIEHVVVLMMENHSYDNRLGMLFRPGARPSFAEPPRLAQPLAAADPSALTCSVTGPGTIPPPGSVTG